MLILSLFPSSHSKPILNLPHHPTIEASSFSLISFQIAWISTFNLSLFISIHVSFFFTIYYHSYTCFPISGTHIYPQFPRFLPFVWNIIPQLPSRKRTPLLLLDLSLSYFSELVLISHFFLFNLLLFLSRLTLSYLLHKFYTVFYIVQLLVIWHPFPLTLSLTMRTISSAYLSIFHLTSWS